jgi:hypothetical protein
MFKFGKEDYKLIDSLLSGKKDKNVNKWNAIYNVLKVFGFTGVGIALLELGITIPFAMCSGLIGTSLLGVNLLKVRPARIAKENEDLAKQNLMLKIQAHLEDSNVVIDGRSFTLERTAVVDSTKPIIVREVSVSADGEENVEDKQIFRDGLVEEYVRCSDNNNELLCWLRLARRYVTETQVTGKNKYETRQVPRDCAFMLESSEVINLPQEVRFQTHAYDDSNVEDMVNVPMTKSRRP